MSPSTTSAARKAQLAQIHIARKDLERTQGLTEESYRDLLGAKFGGLRSAADLSPAQLDELLAHFARMGWKGSRAKPSSGNGGTTATRPAWSPALKKLWSLWQQLHTAGLVQDRSSKALTAWAKAQTAGADKTSGCDRLEWLTGQQLAELTESAKHWLARAATATPTTTGAADLMERLRRRQPGGRT